MKCLRCDVEMTNHGRQEFQLGCTGILLGNLPNLIAGAMVLEVCSCPKCRKVEFFMPDAEPVEVDELFDGGLPTVTCPECGEVHDLDYPKCPNCGHKYEE